MYNHAPVDYLCPFCLLAQGVENESLSSQQAHIFYRDNFVTAFVPSHSWPNNHGNALVIPNQHYENLYDLPDDLGAQIHALARRIALAMKKAYDCAGISTRQHNEPAGNQDVWHYHLHIFPRNPGDHLYGSLREFVPPEERVQYAEILRAQLFDERKERWNADTRAGKMD